LYYPVLLGLLAQTSQFAGKEKDRRRKREQERMTKAFRPANEGTPLPMQL